MDKEAKIGEYIIAIETVRGFSKKAFVIELKDNESR